MKTKRGIYHNLKESDYIYTIGAITFHFSSELYRSKFERAHEAEAFRFNEALNNIYKMKFAISADELAWIRLYVMIEKRGFYLVLNGVEIDCLEKLRFVVTPSCKVSYDE